MKAEKTVIGTPDLRKERNDRCIPAAIELLKLIASNPDLAKGLGGQVEDKDRLDIYEPIHVALMTFMIQNNVLIDDVQYIFSLAIEAVSHVSHITEQSTNMNLEKAEAKLWGVKDTAELTFANLLEVYTKE